MKKLLLYLCTIIFVFAGLSTQCHATAITEFYQSGIGTYESVFIPGIGDTGTITSVIDFTYPADQKYTFDFSAGTFVSQNDDLFYFQNLPFLNPVPLRVSESGIILPGGDPTNFTALVNATEFVDDTSSPLYGLGISYTATYDIMRNETLGTGTLYATVAGLLITDSGSIHINGTGSYTSGTSPVPEPTTMLLLGSGLLGLAGYGRRKKLFKK
jgi:hypothetical protein